MTTIVRFCLSDDPLKWDFVAFKMKNISSRKHIVGMDVVNDVGVCAKVLLHMWAFNFHDMMSSTE